MSSPEISPVEISSVGEEASLVLKVFSLNATISFDGKSQAYAEYGFDNLVYKGIIEVKMSVIVLSVGIEEEDLESSSSSFFSKLCSHLDIGAFFISSKKKNGEVKESKHLIPFISEGEPEDLRSKVFEDSADVIDSVPS